MILSADRPLLLLTAPVVADATADGVVIFLLTELDTAALELVAFAAGAGEGVALGGASF